ncbi:MAG: Asp-tRNA(Asn)/Glu-tRNA(Gln) amidotransferase subunit GatC [Aerococcus sp.]|nr:Asp-tRNA(Asn)/Glu-tRNA(Gln) amidotransferase subunit GatC [Aerococcus sp.]
MSTIDAETYKHIASLAKLSFSEDEVAENVGTFDDILAMVEQLNEVNTDDVPILRSGIQLKNVMREDEPEAGMSRDELMKNVPTEKNGFIHVPATFDESEGNA